MNSLTAIRITPALKIANRPVVERGCEEVSRHNYHDTIQAKGAHAIEARLFKSSQVRLAAIT